MCEGIRGWIDKEVAIGRAEGHAEGHIDGQALGIIQMARKYHVAENDNQQKTCIRPQEPIKILLSILHQVTLHHQPEA